MQPEISTYQHSRDREQVIQLWREVFAGDPPHNDPAQVIDRKIQRDPELFLIARVGGALVATVLGGYDGVRGWMYHLATHPDFRRQGIARQLTAELEARLAELGCVKVNLQVRRENKLVADFYEKLGYAPEPRLSLGKLLGVTSERFSRLRSSK